MAIGDFCVTDSDCSINLEEITPDQRPLICVSNVCVESGGAGPLTGPDCRLEGQTCISISEGTQGTPGSDNCCSNLICGDLDFNNLQVRTRRVGTDSRGRPIFETYSETPGICISPPSTPTEYNYSLTLTKNIPTVGNVDVEVVQGENAVVTRKVNILNGSRTTWSSTSQELLVNVVATPSAGYRFVRWNIVDFILPSGVNLTGNFTSASEQFSLPANVEVEIEAVFEKIQEDIVTVVLINNPLNRGDVQFVELQSDAITSVDSKTIRVTETPGGTTVRVLATPSNENTYFIRWERRNNNGEIVDTSETAESSFLINRVQDNETGTIELIAYWGVTDVPETWVRCSDNSVNEGIPPNGFREVASVISPTGTCWEPKEDVAIDLRNLTFTYQRGSSNFPAPQSFTAENKSFALSYRITISTNNTLFDVSPQTFVLEPRGTQQFSIGVNRNNIGTFGDGTSQFGLQVKTEQL